MTEGKCEKLCTEKISFERLRYRFDLIEAYKFINNKYQIDPQSLFSLPYRTESYMVIKTIDKIFKPSARADIHCYTETLSLIVLWVPGIYRLPG